MQVFPVRSRSGCLKQPNLEKFHNLQDFCYLLADCCICCLADVIHLENCGTSTELATHSWTGISGPFSGQEIARRTDLQQRSYLGGTLQGSGVYQQETSWAHQRSSGPSSGRSWSEFRGAHTHLAIIDRTSTWLSLSAHPPRRH